MFIILLLFLLFKVGVVNAVDVDREQYDLIKKNRTKNPTEINTSIVENNFKSDYEKKKSVIISNNISGKEINEKSYGPQTYSYSSNIIYNGNFESGHSNWVEWYKGWDGNWTDDYNFIITSGSSGYNSWYSYISDNDWLVSDVYQMPSNVVDYRVSYKYRFVYWGTCTYGTNAIGVYLVDKTTSQIYTIDSFWGNSDPYNYEYESANFYASTQEAGIASTAGHKIDLEFLHINDDPNCTMAFYLDNVSVEPVLYIADYIITTSAGANGTISSGSAVQLGSNYTVNIYPNSGYEISSVLVDGVDVGPVSYYNLNNIQAAHSVQANFSISSSPLNRVYRFWNRIDGRHFYTMSDIEMTGLINNNISEWKYEGVAYKSLSSQLNDSVPLYRFWNKIMGNHFYTTSVIERDGLIANNSNVWNYEGIAYYVYPQGSITADTFVYRFWNKIRGNHFYTTSVVERDGLIANNSDVWNYEGLAWKVDD